jgi:hypothetical protein
VKEIKLLTILDGLFYVCVRGHPEPAVDVDVRALFTGAVKPGLEVLRQGSGRPTYRPDRMADDASGDPGA